MTKRGQWLFFCFSGPHLWHKKVPRPGIESELQPLAYTTATATWDSSATSTTVHGNAGSLTHLVRPGIELAPHGY